MRSKTTPLLSYRDTLYIYPETGCVDVVPTGYVSGIPSPLVVDNSPPSTFTHSLFSLPLSLSLVPSAHRLDNYSIPDGPSQQLPSPSSRNPIAKLSRVSVFVYLASISYARGGWNTNCIENQLSRSSYLLGHLTATHPTGIPSSPLLPIFVIAKVHKKYAHHSRILIICLRISQMSVNRREKVGVIFSCCAFIMRRKTTSAFCKRWEQNSRSCRKKWLCMKKKLLNKYILEIIWWKTSESHNNDRHKLYIT